MDEISKIYKDVVYFNAREKRDNAALALAEAADRLNGYGGGPLREIYEEEFDLAYDAFDKACSEMEMICHGWQMQYTAPKFEKGGAA